MLMSSMMGAIAFQKDLGAVHSCAHALSTVADLHHGLANGIMIDHVMRFNLPAATAKMAELAHVARRRRAATRQRRGARPRVHRLARRAEGPTRHSGEAVATTARRGRVTQADIPRAGRDRHRRHLPPDQSAPVHARGLREALRRGALSAALRAMLKIGISACFFHADPQRAIFKGMTLQYIEQNVAHWLMQRDVLAFMVPSPEGRTRRAGSKATRRRLRATSSTAWC